MGGRIYGEVGGWLHILVTRRVDRWVEGWMECERTVGGRDG